ncbi:MAG: 2'-5' RNA ligase family protein [Rhizomicrobium sp.]
MSYASTDPGPAAASRGDIDRLFLALVPDGAIAARVAALAQGLKRAHRFTGRPIKPEHLHVTLFSLGDWEVLPPSIPARAGDALEDVQAPSFVVTFDRAVSFRSDGNYPFVLLAGENRAPLKAMRASLGAALSRHKLGRFARGPFTPHMTLLYDARAADEAPIAPISWTARDIVLVHSLVGRTRHVHLVRRPLGAQ